MPKVHVTKPQDGEVDEMVDETGAQETAPDASTPEPKSSTVAKTAPVLINEDRAVGGRFVSLGGGERAWVPEESTLHDEDPRVSDEEFAAAQKGEGPSIRSKQ